MYQVQLESIMLLPFFLLILLTLISLLGLVVARTRAVLNKSVPENYYKLKVSEDVNFKVPERLILLDNHFKNLLELPIFYYLACIMIIIIGDIQPIDAIFSGSFVLLRVIHSVIHLSNNNVTYRFIAFLLSLIVLISMWINIAYNFLF